MKALIGSHDVLMVTLDTLRFDVAADALGAGRTPALGELLGAAGWEARHSPASFTYAAHHAFFAGFLPTPSAPGPHPRLFAAAFGGSETIAADTFVFDEPDVVRGLAARGYHTACVGGVGFFNQKTALGSVLPGLFAEAVWSEALGVTSPTSPEAQRDAALAIVARLPPSQRVFLFLNVSALHQPNCIFSAGASCDDCRTMTDALAAVDAPLGEVVRAMRARAPLVCILTSDHGTAYGEDGFVGHRCAHEVVWTVPYAERVFSRLP
jgi:hypothetical protein